METNVYGAQLVGELWHLWLENWWTERVADVFAKKTLRASKHGSHSKIREFPHCQRWDGDRQSQISTFPKVSRLLVSQMWISHPKMTVDVCSSISWKMTSPKTCRGCFHFEAHLPSQNVGGTATIWRAKQYTERPEDNAHIFPYKMGKLLGVASGVMMMKNDVGFLT